MPLRRNRRNKRNARNIRGRGGKILSVIDSVLGASTWEQNVIRVPFRVEADTNFIVGTAMNSFLLHPQNLGDRITPISDCFSHWKCVALRMKAINTSVVSSRFALSYSNAYDGTGLSGIDEMLDAPVFDHAGVQSPQVQVIVPSRVLRSGERPWYRTRDTTGPDGVQGQVTVAASSPTAAGTVYLVMEGILLFANPIDPDANPFNRMRPIANLRKDKSQEEKELLVTNGEKNLLNVFPPVNPELADEKSADGCMGADKPSKPSGSKLSSWF